MLRKGDKGPNVILLQKHLFQQGFWPSYIPYSENFGPTTDKYVRKFQEANNLVVDGKVGGKTLELLNLELVQTPLYNEKWKDVTIQGSTFPDSPIKHYKINLNSEMLNEYLPTADKVFEGLPRGFKLLCIAMAYKEGYRKGTRSYRYNNPGNIGNTDSGANKGYPTLEDGIKKQIDYITSIVEGRHRSFPKNKKVTIKPYFSPEIAKHHELYGMSPYLPGYEFTFTGQLDQFAKIYATGARAGNSYVSTIISFFKKHGITLTPESKIQDIIKIV